MGVQPPSQDLFIYLFIALAPGDRGVLVPGGRCHGGRGTPGRFYLYGEAKDLVRGSACLLEGSTSFCRHGGAGGQTLPCQAPRPWVWCCERVSTGLVLSGKASLQGVAMAQAWCKELL